MDSLPTYVHHWTLCVFWGCEHEPILMLQLLRSDQESLPMHRFNRHPLVRFMPGQRQLPSWIRCRDGLRLQRWLLRTGRRKLLAVSGQRLLPRRHLQFALPSQHRLGCRIRCADGLHMQRRLLRTQWRQLLNVSGQHLLPRRQLQFALSGQHQLRCRLRCPDGLRLQRRVHGRGWRNM